VRVKSATFTPPATICYTANVPSLAQPVEGIINLPPQDQLFCALVASGWNYSQAAEKAGWEKTYGWNKIQVPAIREFIKELSLAAPEEAIRIELGADLTMIRRRLMHGDIDSEERACIDLRIKAVMASAKFHGLIVDRKSVDKRSLDLTAVTVEMLRQELGRTIDALDPGSRGAIEERVKAVASRSRKAVETVTVEG
jgi:hypothetical protein